MPPDVKPNISMHQNSASYFPRVSACCRLPFEKLYKPTQDLTLVQTNLAYYLIGWGWGNGGPQQPLGSFVRPQPKLKTNTWPILRNFNQHRFIPNFNPTQVEDIFFSSLQLSNCSGLSPVVIQMITGWGSGGHPCDSDNRSLFRVQGLPRLSPPESAKEFPLCLNGRADRQHHSIPHETHSISGSHTRRLKRHVGPIHMRRGAMPVKSPAPLRQIWGIGECPAPVFMLPKHPRRRYSWPKHRKQRTGSFLNDLTPGRVVVVGGGARWRNSVGSYAMDGTTESKLLRK